MSMGFQSIRRRILVSFVLALITFASTVGYGLHQLSAIGRELDAVNVGFLPMSKVGVELTALVRQLDRDHDRFARTGSQSVAARRANTALYGASIEDAVTRGRAAAGAAVMGLSHPDDIEVLGRVESVLHELDEQTVSYVDAVDEWLNHANDADPIRPQLLADLDRRRQALAAGADLTQALVDGQISQISRRAARAQNRALAISGTLGILSLLFASVMAGLALVSLRPINSLIQQVQRVAAGDLTGRVHLQTQDEMGLLAQEFNTMAEAVAERDTALVERAQVLESLQGRLQKVLDTISAGLLVVENGAVEMRNPAALELWSIEPGAALPDWLASLGHGHHECVEADGKHYEMVAVPFGEGGTLMIGEDVTERLAVRKRLMRSERLALVGRMLAQITHEVRNPLNAMSLNAELLCDEVTGSEAKAMLGTITSEIGRLEVLTGRYLHLSRPRVPEMSTVSPRRLIDELVATEAVALREARVDVKIHGETSGTVTIDADAVARAVRNLIRNATEAGAKAVDILIAASDSQVSITVSDDGPGLTGRQANQAFDPFFTTKARGTGLGLAISRQELEEIAGSLDYDHTYTSGARFTIAVPLDVGDEV
jgi:signal transduction histidine kinase/HAMP domain-containing protein